MDEEGAGVLHLETSENKTVAPKFRALQHRKTRKPFPLPPLGFSLLCNSPSHHPVNSQARHTGPGAAGLITASPCSLRRCHQVVCSFCNAGPDALAIPSEAVQRGVKTALQQAPTSHAHSSAQHEFSRLQRGQMCLFVRCRMDRRRRFDSMSLKNGSISNVNQCLA